MVGSQGCATIRGPLLKHIKKKKQEVINSFYCSIQSTERFFIATYVRKYAGEGRIPRSMTGDLSKNRGVLCVRMLG